MLKPAVSHDKGEIDKRYCSHSFCHSRSREDLLRASALYYLNIIDYKRQRGIKYTDNVLDVDPSSPYMEFLRGSAKSNRQPGEQEGETHWHHISLDTRQETVQR